MSDDTPQRTAPRTAAGFSDTFADDVVLRSEMMATICRVYERFGFAPLETPAIEYLDVLGKFLPESDEPAGGVFAFRDDDEQWLSLRYDLTAPLSRVVAQYGTTLPQPFRRYQAGPVWRREKPGPGRFRQFYQCDFDTVGSSSAAADAEACAILYAGLAALGLAPGEFEVRVNDRKVLNGVLDTLGIVAPERQMAVLRAIDKLDRLGLEGVGHLLRTGRRDPSGDFTPGAQLSDDQAKVVLEYVSAGDPSREIVLRRMQALVGESAIGREGVAELETIARLLDAMALPGEAVRFDPSIVRGLGYYTGPVFEAVLTFEITDEKGQRRSFGSVAAGGRYDDLVERFTGAKVPATGASLGVDRLLDALVTSGRARRAARPGPVVVSVMDQAHLIDYQAMVSELRGAGIAAELYLGDRGFRAQMKYADKRNALAVVIAGSDEFARGEVSIKDMRLGDALAKSIEDREAWRKGQPAQRSVARADLLVAIREILHAPR
jgi:histidyl-tRNA synthetase